MVQSADKTGHKYFEAAIYCTKLLGPYYEISFPSMVINVYLTISVKNAITSNDKIPISCVTQFLVSCKCLYFFIITSLQVIPFLFEYIKAYCLM